MEIAPDNVPECLTWLVQVVHDTVETPCVLDSPNPRSIEAALAIGRDAY